MKGFGMNLKRERLTIVSPLERCPAIAEPRSANNVSKIYTKI
jgi:hypothetical protein